MDRRPPPLEPLTASEYSDRIRERFSDVMRVDGHLSVHRGWGPIIEHAVARAAAVSRRLGAALEIHGVKQKLGELRVDWRLRTNPMVYVRDDELGGEDGMRAASGWLIRAALGDGRAVYRRLSDGGYEEDPEAALRALAIHCVVEAEFDGAARVATVTCEFCGRFGALEAYPGTYIAIVCDEHRGAGRPPLRGDELASGRRPGSVRRLWSRLDRSSCTAPKPADPSS